MKHDQLAKIKTNLPVMNFGCGWGGVWSKGMIIGYKGKRSDGAIVSVSKVESSEGRAKLWRRNDIWSECQNVYGGQTPLSLIRQCNRSHFFWTFYVFSVTNHKLNHERRKSEMLTVNAENQEMSKSNTFYFHNFLFSFYFREYPY